MDKQLGLFRFATFKDREEMERNLSVSFEDLYDSLIGMRENLVDLEQVINRILHGASHGVIREDDLR